MPDNAIIDELTAEQRAALAAFSVDASQLPERVTNRRVSREYYEGKHGTQLTERQRKYLQIKTGQEFNDNYCPVVVDALSERLVVTGFTVSAESDAQAKAVQDATADWWKRARMDQVQRDVHTAAIRDGGVYLLVEWDADQGRPVWSMELAYDGTEGMEVYYDDRKRPEYAAKIWGCGDGKRRLNLYYPDRVEKYISGEGGWHKYITEGQAWPEKWGVNAIPVVHFKNKSQGYCYGRSELHDVIPQQNALNKSIIDLVAAADTTAFRVYWATGVDASEFEITPGALFSTEESTAAFGAIPGEDLSKLIEYKDAFAVEIARISRTPQSFFQLSGTASSGETLKQQESGLLSKVADRQVGFGNAWEDALLLAVKVYNAYGPEPKLSINVSIEAQWKDAQTRNGPEHLTELEAKKRLGVPQETLWAEMGYSADQIEGMKQSEEYRLARIKMLFDTANLAGIDPGTLAKQMGWTAEEIALLYSGIPEQ